VEKTVNENRDRAPATEVSGIEAAIAAARSAAQAEDIAAIRRATEELQKASHAFAEQLYTQQASGAAPKAGDHKTDDVVEGEVVEA
jgi:molecular chaperone DnaK